MTVHDIVTAWLREHGFDGLCDEDECACGLDDLMPCEGTGWARCVAARRVVCADPADCDWWVSEAEHPHNMYVPAELGGVGGEKEEMP